MSEVEPADSEVLSLDQNVHPYNLLFIGFCVQTLFMYYQYSLQAALLLVNIDLSIYQAT